MGLSEPRKRVKYSIDPNALQWTNDESKFGKRLMEKLGWKNGEGLGAKSNGMTENIKVKFKSDTKGIGYNKNDYDNVWLDHQDDFESVLSDLNKAVNNKVVTEVASVDEKPINSLAQKSKERAKRLHYSKFTKSKDLSTASQHDLACILGTEKRSKMAKISSADDDTSQNEEETRTGFGSNVFIEGPKQIKSTNESKTENILFSTNPMSIGDYFAQKMKSKLSNSNGSTTEKKIDTIKENELKHKNDEALEEQEEQTSKKKKKSKRKEIEKESISNIEANECEPTEVLKLKKKKKSKLQEPEQEQEEETITSIETNERQAIEMSPKKEKKSKRKELIVNEACSQIDSESTEIKLKKKKSKLQEAEEAELELEPVVKEDEKGINEKLELSFKGSNVTQLYGYSPYNISCNLDTILSEKAKKADRKRILVEKNLEKNPKFYEMSKKPLITFKHKE